MLMVALLDSMEILGRIDERFLRLSIRKDFYRCFALKFIPTLRTKGRGAALAITLMIL